MLTLDDETFAAIERKTEAQFGTRLLDFFACRPELADLMAEADASAFVEASVALARLNGLRMEQDVARFAWLALMLRLPGAPAPRDPCDVAGLPCDPVSLRIVEDAVRERLQALT